MLIYQSPFFVNLIDILSLRLSNNFASLYAIIVSFQIAMYIGFYSVDVGLKSSLSDPSQNFNGNKIFALGDLNNDKLNDIVTVSDDQKSFQPYYFNAESYKFTASPLPTAVTSGYIITSIFIGKDNSGQQNLYVTI